VLQQRLGSEATLMSFRDEERLGYRTSALT